MTTPPFAPPYKERLSTDAGERWVEVGADGSRTDVVAPPSLASLDPPGVVEAVTNRPSKPGVSFLKVPYAEKDEAKGLGARWDAARKKWYVPAGVDPAPFGRWLA